MKLQIKYKKKREPMKKSIILIAVILVLTFGTAVNAHEVSGLDFYSLFEYHGNVMLLIDSLTGEILHANQAAADFYGYTIEDLESMNIQSINTVSFDEAEKIRKKTAADGKNFYKTEHRLANGEIRAVEIYACAHEYENGTLIFAVIYDITDRLHAEAKNTLLTAAVIITVSAVAAVSVFFAVILNRERKKLRDRSDEINYLYEIHRTFKDADSRLIYLKDENLKYIFVNKALEKFFGRNEKDIIGHTVNDFADYDLSFLCNMTDHEVIEKKTNIISEHAWKDRVFQTIKFPVKLPEGRYGVGAYLSDVTAESNNKKELTRVNGVLRENEEKLQLILDSAAEAIYGIDLEGNCTFCNKSCLEMLGFGSQDELLGKNMHWLIHHSRRDGTQIPIDRCRIYQSFKQGQGAHIDDEVLWRADGTCFDAEYYSYPQYKDGKVIGAVVTFFDISERRKTESWIRYLNNHDSLTGLYNRRYFEEALAGTDMECNYPISVIMCDVNGLKLINDVFGHGAGDTMLQNAAQAIKEACGEDDIAARWGGDEFIIILPRSDHAEAQQTALRIKELFALEKINGIDGSISVGCATKETYAQKIEQIIKNADDRMYAQKIADRKIFSSSAVETIFSIYSQIPSEKEHSESVRGICIRIAEAMNLTQSEKCRLKEAALMHDIGKVVIDKKILSKTSGLTEEEEQIFRQHTVAGYRILNSSDRTFDLAKYVLSHHENWDGSGYPKGIGGDAIPKLARIIAVAEKYDELTRVNGMSEEEALNDIAAKSGTLFDPEIVKALNEISKRRGEPV